MNNRIFSLRRQYNISQQQLANYLKVSRKTIGNYELGITEPTFNIVIKLADYFKVSIDYLLGYSDSISPSVRPDKLSSSDELKLKVANMIYSLNDKQVKAINDLIDSFGIK